MSQYRPPYLEVGVGTGRFAQALAVGHGVDPSRGAVVYARERGINVALGVGEALPYRAGVFGGALIVFTLCFVREPVHVLNEVHRTLAPRGGLVLGLLLRGTPWADWYAKRGAEGHPVYRSARFHSREEVISLLDEAGFRPMLWRSSLHQEPGLQRYDVEEPSEESSAGGGFSCLAAVKKSA
jgi:SAM-dependent methyltransferase